MKSNKLKLRLHLKNNSIIKVKAQLANLMKSHFLVWHIQDLRLTEKETKMS